MQMGLHNTSMRHVGMDREAAKEVVKSRMYIGQQYLLKSRNEGVEKKKRIC